MAQGRPAHQSSTLEYNLASKAVDGSSQNRIENISAITQDEKDPWWAVDLIDSCTVDTVVITWTWYWLCK